MNPIGSFLTFSEKTGDFIPKMRENNRVLKPTAFMEEFIFKLISKILKKDLKTDVFSLIQKGASPVGTVSKSLK